MTEFTNDIFVRAHEKAWSKAVSKAPELDVNELIEVAVNFIMGRKSVNEIVKDLSEDYGPAVKQYLQSFSEQAIKNASKESNNETFTTLAKGSFAKDLKKTTLGIVDLVQKYMKGDIGEVQFLDGLINSGFKELSVDFMQAAGIDKNIFFEADGSIRSLSSPVIGYCATVKAYEMMMKALEDASVAYEHRLLVEEECRKTIEQIKQYRAEMEAAVNKYLTRHYETFELALETMNQALLENDSDGYIRGNVEIQKLLGYDVQFTNQEEFDDLMDSDIALKL